MVSVYSCRSGGAQKVLKALGTGAMVALMVVVTGGQASAKLAPVGRTAKPVVLSFKASPSHLPSSGGVVVLSASVRHASTCTFGGSGTLKVSCASGTARARDAVGPNRTSSVRRLTFWFDARGKGGTTPKRALTVTEAALAPTPTTTTTTTTIPSTTTTTGQSATAHVGATLSFADDNGNPYTVQLTQVIDPAQGADEFDQPNAGYRFVAAVFDITDTGAKSISDDANNNSTVVGSDDQDYTADFDSVSECTNFNDGEYQIDPGQSSTGCVVFQLPTSVTVAQVQWSPNGGFGGSFGSWDVP